MGIPTKIGSQTVILAADIADSSHPINLNSATSFNGIANAGAVVGQLYIRDNGTNDYDIVMKIEIGATGKWVVLDGSGTVITPS